MIVLIGREATAASTEVPAATPWWGRGPVERRSPRCMSTPRIHRGHGLGGGGCRLVSPCRRESPPACRDTAASLWQWGEEIQAPPPCHCQELASNPSLWRSRMNLWEREKKPVTVDLPRKTTQKMNRLYKKQIHIKNEPCQWLWTAVLHGCHGNSAGLNYLEQKWP